MNFLKSLFLRYRELIVYCMIGVTGATLDFIIYAVLTTRFEVHYQVANALSVSFGIVNNFFLNYYFNFKVREHMLRRLLMFYCVGLLGWATGAALLWLMIDQLGVNGLIAKVVTIFAITAMQFLINKFVTFRKAASA